MPAVSIVALVLVVTRKFAIRPAISGSSAAVMCPS